MVLPEGVPSGYTILILPHAVNAAGPETAAPGQALAIPVKYRPGEIPDIFQRRQFPLIVRRQRVVGSIRLG